MTSEAILELAIRARDLTAGALADVGGNMEKVATRAAGAAGRIGAAFAGTGRSISVGLGSAVDSLVTGGELGQALLTLGGFMAGELVENFGGQAIEKLTSSALVGAITAPIAAIGSAIGGVLSAAIPIGMAALPFLLIGAIVVAITALIVSEEIRNKVLGFAGELVGNLIGALGRLLGALVGVFGDAFGAAWRFVIQGVVPFVANVVSFLLSIPGRIIGLGAAILETIIRGLSGLPGRVADLVGDAFRNLRIDIGPFHITGQGITIDLPRIDLPHFAEGVVGFRGGLAVVGEKGPELVRLPAGSDVIPNARSAGAPIPGVFIQGVTEGDIERMIERRLYFRLMRAAPTLGRT